MILRGGLVGSARIARHLLAHVRRADHCIRLVLSRTTARDASLHAGIAVALRAGDRPLAVDDVLVDPCSPRAKVQQFEIPESDYGPQFSR